MTHQDPGRDQDGAAEAGIAVFKVAFERWVEDGGTRTSSQLIRQSMDELQLVTMGRAPTGARVSDR